MSNANASGNSRLDPRAVFALVAYLSITAVAIRDARILTPLAGLALLCASCMGVSFRWLFIRLKRVWQVILAVSLLQSVFTPSGRIWLKIGGIPLLTSGGLLVGLVVTERLAVLIIGGGMLARYPGRVLIQGMIQLNLPFELAYMVSVGIRFIPLLGQELRDSLIAIQLRGVEFEKLKLRQRLRVYVYLLLPSVAASLHHARGLSISMEMRGFRAYPKRTSFFTLCFARRDYLLCVGTFFLAAATAAICVLV